MSTPVSPEPLVSVIMAARNTAPFIDAAIASIAAQTYENWELIVIDNASTDGTTEIIRAWMAKDARIHGIFNAVSGNIASSKNKGAAAATGTYLAILDSDDLALPERLKKQVEYMESHTNVVLSGSAARIIDETDRVLGGKTKPPSSPEMRFAMLLQSQCINSSMIFRADAFRKIGGFDAASAAEDYDIACRLQALGQIDNLPEQLISYRVRAASWTHASDTKQAHVRDSLAVTMRNILPYIRREPHEILNLTDALNLKPLGLPKIMRALGIYRTLTLSYQTVNRLAGAERRRILSVYRRGVHSVFVGYVKRIMHRS